MVNGIISSFIIFDSLSFYFNSLNLMLTAYLMFDLYLLIAIIFLLKDVIEAPYIDNNLIFGALTAYILIGVLWGKLYFLNALMSNGSFHGLSQKVEEVRNFGANFGVQFDLLYYSFTTLATLGLGDITPTHHFSKTLTVLEAMFGQLFVSIIIAKLVSVWRFVK